jgi:hypothetical protein
MVTQPGGRLLGVGERKPAEWRRRWVRRTPWSATGSLAGVRVRGIGRGGAATEKHGHEHHGEDKENYDEPT